MSYSFYVETSRPPSCTEVLFAVGREGLCCSERELDELRGDWPGDAILHFYREGISTRAVEVSFENGSFQARIMTASCHEDYELALDLCCAVARAAGAEVESEEGARFRPEEREAEVGRAWIDFHVRSLVSMLLKMAIDEGNVLTMGCTTRDFYLGPRVAKEIAAAGPEQAPARLFDRMREVLYLDTSEEGDVYAANIMALKKPDGQEVRFAVWGPGVRYLFPDVQRLALLAEEQIMIPYEALETLAGPRLTWLDERHSLVEPVPDEEWPALIERARPLAVEI